MNPTYSEILPDEGILTFGSGKSAANGVIEAGETRPLHIVREVINLDSEPEVGGGLQFGEFGQDDFKLYGVTGYELDASGALEKYTYNLRGFQLYEGDFASNMHDLHISHPFIRAFEDEIP